MQALMGCVRVLKTVQFRLATGGPIPINSIDAALARLEGTKT
jgi:hypothetical protein